MNLGELVYGPFPTRYGSMQLFPGSETGGPFPTPGSPQGAVPMSQPVTSVPNAAWLAPSSAWGKVVPAIFNPYQTPPSDTVAPMQLLTPMPSVIVPRSDQVTAADVTRNPVCEWVNNNPGLAVAAALGIFFLVSGGKHGR